jgi:hypothetical protein
MADVEKIATKASASSKMFPKAPAISPPAPVVNDIPQPEESWYEPRRSAVLCRQQQGDSGANKWEKEFQGCARHLYIF